PWDEEKRLAPEAMDNLNRRYGLDKPIWEQYLTYAWSAVHGDLGVSFQYRDRPVTDLLGEGLPKTATLGLFALAIAVIVGLPLGIAAALRQNSYVDYICLFFATLGASTPSFVLGFAFMVVFAVWLHWLPTSGWGTWQKLIMPAITLSVLPTAFLARMMRSSMLEVIRQEYVKTANAKGLPRDIVLRRHILKNALIPVVTVLGPMTAELTVGSFIVENVFSVPGIGRMFVQAVGARDYGVIMGLTLFFAFLVVMANLVVDIVYAYVDPRIRYD
ncbi:MAG: ABC transporter permease, partial [Dehalococcoidia bacterium]|nr:ABC transporter permease [Dehalococcoidia bacterium]